MPAGLPMVAPMLALAARGLPAREDEWAAEVKWDGARAIAYAAGGGTVVIRGRSGRDVSGSYPEVAGALAWAAGDGS